MEMKRAEFINDWHDWKLTLKKAVDMGETVGLSENTIEKIGVKVGSFLSSNVDPENREQRLLQELWRVGDDADRKALSGMIVKMVQSDKTLQ